MRPIGFRTGMAVVAILSASAPAIAAGHDQRFVALTSAMMPPLPAIDSAMALPVTALSLTDRQALQRTRTRSYVSTLEPFELAIDVSRFLGGRPDPVRPDSGSDRFAGQASSATLGLPLTSDLTLQSSLTMTRIKRHLTAVADIFRPRTSFVTTAGLGVASASGPTVRLDWVHSALQGTRTPFERMAELMGGAPAAAKGFRLSLLGSADTTNPVQWSFSLASMQRARTDSAFAIDPGHMPDRRAELSLRFAF